MSENAWPLNWGQIIDKITELVKTDREIADKTVLFDFCGLGPTGAIYCDRGDYSHRSIQCGTVAHYPGEITVKQFLQMMEKEIGTVKEGYKGGSYTCRRETEATVTLEANYSTDTRIFDVTEFYGGILLTTGRWE